MAGSSRTLSLNATISPALNGGEVFRLNVFGRPCLQFTVKVFSEVSGIRRDGAGTIELELLGGAVLGLGEVERIGN